MSSPGPPSRLLSDLLFLVTLSLFLSCAHHAVRARRPLFIAPSNPGYASLPSVRAEQVRSLMEDPETVLLDARSQETYARRTIPGSRSLPLHSTLDEATLRSLAGADRVIVFCASHHCNAARELALRLRAHGVSGVRVFSGGLAEWMELGYPVEAGRL